MLTTRRLFVKKTLALTSYALGLSFSQVSLANWIANHFSRQTISQSITQLFPDQELHTSDRISLQLPNTAENGSVVPITISSTIPDVDTIYILSEKNPVPLIAQFSLNPDLETYLGARFKMQETCDVMVVLKAKDQYYQTRQKVKVTLGGCGG
ncbi:MAG: thiosulfate oxidation carrier protein SoxY [Methyloprofundus sp.]|nr:thiosulfate oxidation carrier protein SoxY [Methyloprofundus sp.]MBW6453521.1 thiosulfate oxidation carrier protein SoxY [Methyloprofundus sp.]